MKFLGLIIALVVSLSTARAQTIVSFMGSGNDVLELCTAPQGTNGCVAYVAGVVDSMAGGNPVAGYRTCLPKGVVTGQLVDITVTYLTSHASTRHLAGSHLVAAAISGAFPCPATH
jgi:hypothetical protein